MIDAACEAIALAFASALRLTFMVVVASNIHANVPEPADKLLSDHRSRRGNGSLFHQFGKLMRIVANLRGILLSRLGYEDHISLQVTSGLVMLAMGDFPREIRNEQGGVADPTDRVIESLGW